MEDNSHTKTLRRQFKVPWCLSIRAASALVQRIKQYDARGMFESGGEGCWGELGLLEWLMLLKDPTKKREDGTDGPDYSIPHTPKHFSVVVEGVQAEELMCCLTELFSAFPDTDHCVEANCNAPPVVFLDSFWGENREMRFCCREGHSWSRSVCVKSRLRRKPRRPAG